MKQSVKLNNFDSESYTGDYREPYKDSPFYKYHHKLWEMRFGYQQDNNKTFDENLRAYAKYNYKKSLIKTILDAKIEYFDKTGEII